VTQLSGSSLGAHVGPFLGRAAPHRRRIESNRAGAVSSVEQPALVGQVALDRRSHELLLIGRGGAVRRRIQTGCPQVTLVVGGEPCGVIASTRFSVLGEVSRADGRPALSPVDGGVSLNLLGDLQLRIGETGEQLAAPAYEQRLLGVRDGRGGAFSSGRGVNLVEARQATIDDA